MQLASKTRVYDKNVYSTARCKGLLWRGIKVEIGDDNMTCEMRYSFVLLHDKPGFSMWYCP